jgi:hypothetical protein
VSGSPSAAVVRRVKPLRIDTGVGRQQPSPLRSVRLRCMIANSHEHLRRYGRRQAMQRDDTQFNEQGVHQEIGRLNIAFQDLENELLEIEWFCRDRAAATSPPPRGFGKIVKTTKRVVNSFLNRAGVPQGAAVRTRFANAFTAARAASKMRNRTVHSLYRQHETFLGSPELLRSWVERTNAGVVERKFETVTARTIASTVEDVNLAHSQLFALHRVLMYEMRAMYPS